MNSLIVNNMSSIRDAWSEEERRLRNDSAGAMQLQLRALVVLSELSNPREEREKEALSVANACELLPLTTQSSASHFLRTRSSVDRDRRGRSDCRCLCSGNITATPSAFFANVRIWVYR